MLGVNQGFTDFGLWETAEGMEVTGTESGWLVRCESRVARR